MVHTFKEPSTGPFSQSQNTIQFSELLPLPELQCVTMAMCNSTEIHLFITDAATAFVEGPFCAVNPLMIGERKAPFILKTCAVIL